MITDVAKFNGILNIASDNNTEFLDYIIAQKEPELLKSWFGYALAKDIQSLTPSAEAQVLIDGGEFTDSSGDLQELVGLKTILPYIMYFYIVKNQQSRNSEQGERESTYENAEQVSPVQKLCKNYNTGVKYVNEMIDYIEDRTDTYDTYIVRPYLNTINQFGI